MIKKLRKALAEDKELYYAYQANIAMAFMDTYDQAIMKKGGKYLNRAERHEVANDAAKHFLNLLIR